MTGRFQGMAKAKGTTALSLVKFLRGQPERAREELSPALHFYLSEKIQTSAWYPEEDVLALIRCMVAMLPMAREDALQMMGQSVAREHLEGVYEHLRIDASDPGAMGRRAFALWSTMHDSGALKIEAQGDSEAIFDLRDYAHPSKEMCKIVCAYFGECVRLGGAFEPEAVEIACRLSGAESCRYRVRWSVS